MHRIPFFGVAVFVCLMAIMGLGQAKEAAPPEEIAEIIGDAVQVCRAQGGKPDTADILRGEDLNGDGGNDWIVDFAKMKCDGGSNPACNKSGCTLQLYFWDGYSEWDLVFEDFVKSYKFSQSGDTRIMHVATSGIPCNKPPEKTCSYNYRLEKDAVVPVP